MSRPPPARPQAGFTLAQAGFTLMEVVVALGIAGLVAAAVLSLQGFGLRAWRTAEGLLERQQSVRLAVVRVTAAAREARAVLLPPAGAAGDSLELLWRPGATVRFWTEPEAGGRLALWRRCDGGGCPPAEAEAQPVAGGLTSVRFEHLLAGAPLVVVTVRAETDDGRPVVLKAGAVLRNGR